MIESVDRDDVGFLSVIGPMRGVLEGSKLRPYFATPHGSMMLAGPFGLVRAWAEKNHELTVGGDLARALERGTTLDRECRGMPALPRPLHRAAARPPPAAQGSGERALGVRPPGHG